MSDDIRIHNGTPSEGGADDAEIGRQSESSLPASEPQARYDVGAAALGALSATEETELYSAAAEDPVVSADLAAMEAVVAELARLAPSAVMNRGRSAGIRSRLVARAAATHVGRPVARDAAAQTEGAAASRLARSAGTAPSARRPRSSGGPGSAPSPRPITGTHAIPFEPPARMKWGRVLGGLALAAGLVIAAFGIFDWQAARKTEFGPTASVTDTALVTQVAELRAIVARKDSLIAALTGMQTRVIDLVSYKSADPMARIFWDQKKQMFIMYASHIHAPPPGRTYQVWLIARGVATPISAGTFMPDSNGSAVMTAKYPMQPGMLSRIAVTEEPDGGVPAPTGPVVFSGVGR